MRKRCGEEGGWNSSKVKQKNGQSIYFSDGRWPAKAPTISVGLAQCRVVSVADVDDLQILIHDVAVCEICSLRAQTDTWILVYLFVGCFVQLVFGRSIKSSNDEYLYFRGTLTSAWLRNKVQITMMGKEPFAKRFPSSPLLFACASSVPYLRIRLFISR